MRPCRIAAAPSRTLLVLMAALPLLAGPARAAETAEPGDPQIERLATAYRAILDNYVRRPDGAKLVDAAIRGMLAALDPQSDFIEPLEFRNLSGSGHSHMMLQRPWHLGIEGRTENGAFKIVAARDDMPAAQAGLGSGDRITRIDGAPVAGMSIFKAFESQYDSSASSVRLTVIRNGSDNAEEVTLVRALPKARDLVARVEGTDVAYLRPPAFNEKVPNQLKEAVGGLRREIGPERLKGYVLDLRNNPGGIPDTGVAMADAFLEGGEIVSTRGANPEHAGHEAATPGDITDGKPMVVLVDGGTAGWAEVVAGALQDHRRATVVGTRTFGKGEAFTIVPLHEGVLRLIVGEYHTPSGRSIRTEGIVPDRSVPRDAPDAPDRQLMAALDVLHGVRTGAADAARPDRAN
jgi:carboxyl-terminal processing protease